MAVKDLVDSIQLSEAIKMIIELLLIDYFKKQEQLKTVFF
jgi:hypothetical protein